MKLPAEIKSVFIDGRRDELFPLPSYANFEKAEDHYRKYGIKVQTPYSANAILQLTEEGETKHSETIGHQLYLISRYDALVLLRGWELSPESRFKASFAASQGIPIYEAYTNNHILIESEPVSKIEYHTAPIKDSRFKPNMN